MVEAHCGRHTYVSLKKHHLAIQGRICQVQTLRKSCGSAAFPSVGGPVAVSETCFQIVDNVGAAATKSLTDSTSSRMASWTASHHFSH